MKVVCDSPDDVLCAVNDLTPQESSGAVELQSKDAEYLCVDSFESEDFARRYFSSEIAAARAITNKNFAEATVTACVCNQAPSLGPGKYIALAPFLGALVFLQGCSPCEVACEDGCRAHNDTTVALNRETDGKIPTINDIAATFEGTISEPLADLVNEAHALSTGGMPEDVKVTITAESCFGEDYAGYAVTNDSSNRGVYMPESVFVGNLEILDHEIGHLQTNGAHNEAIPELNALEQRVIRRALSSSQYNIRDFLEWALLDPLRLDRELDILLGVSSEYTKADLFVLFDLLANGGDFGKTRERIEQLERHGGLDAALNDAQERYLNTYLPGIYGGSEPWTDINLALMMSSHNWIYKRFDQGMADSYFNAMQYSIIRHYRYSQFIGPTFGLEGFNCLRTRSQDDGFAAEIGETCAGVSATMEVHVNLGLCCYDVVNSSPESTLSFRKWAIDAHGSICATWLPNVGVTDPEPLVLPQEFGTQYTSAFLVIDNKEELLPTDYCR